MKLVEGLYYSKDHEWIKVTGDTFRVGITDFAQHALGEVVYVELPEVDDSFDRGEVFGVIESVKAASDCYMPLGGKVTKANDALEDAPELINEAPFDTWIFEGLIESMEEVEELMDMKGYEAYCNR